MSKVQRTLVVLKPDTIGRTIVGEIISRFERAGIHIAGIKMMRPDKAFLHHHYEGIGQMISRRGQKPFDMTVGFMTKNPVIAMVLEWVEVIEYVRKLVGSTEPKSAAPWTIRWDYAHMSFAHADEENIGVPNLIHASSNPEEAEVEIKHRFAPEEIFDYQPTHNVFTR